MDDHLINDRARDRLWHAYLRDVDNTIQYNTDRQELSVLMMEKQVLYEKITAIEVRLCANRGVQSNLMQVAGELRNEATGGN